MHFKLKSLGIAVPIVLLLGCAGTFKASRLNAPEPPRINEVVVVGHCLCGKYLDAHIESWLAQFEYIEQLKALGCFK